MFEVGRHYEFKMIEDGDEVTFWGEVAAYDHPLLRLADGRMAIQLVADAPFEVVERAKRQEEASVVPGRIINVTSPNFVSAIPDK